MLAYLKYNQLDGVDIERLIARNSDPDQSIQQRVEEIISEVKSKGDLALKFYAEKFDKISLNTLKIEEEEIALLADTISRAEKRALEIAFNNIHRFHSK